MATVTGLTAARTLDLLAEKSNVGHTHSNEVKAVIHAADSNAERPSATIVYWYGTVAPVNAVPRDEWVDESA